MSAVDIGTGTMTTGGKRPSVDSISFGFDENGEAAGDNVSLGSDIEFL